MLDGLPGQLGPPLHRDSPWTHVRLMRHLMVTKWNNVIKSVRISVSRFALEFDRTLPCLLVRGRCENSRKSSATPAEDTERWKRQTQSPSAQRGPMVRRLYQRCSSSDLPSESAKLWRQPRSWRTRLEYKLRAFFSFATNRTKLFGKMGLSDFVII